MCGIAQLRRCPWLFTSEGHVASMQHIYSELSHIPTPARFVGWLFRLLRISNNKDESFKTDLMFVSVSSADKDAEKTFDSFNRMHMIWTDRV